VGWFSLRPSDTGEYELGYRLSVDSWGRGLATEGSRALIDYGFDSLGASRVWAQTMSVNRRSQRVMERCGLRFVRNFHLHWEDPIAGSEAGEVEYALTREEWARSCSTAHRASERGDGLILDEPRD
jgi:RimJ/RimL family protein N-acetyltransferase